MLSLFSKHSENTNHTNTLKSTYSYQPKKGEVSTALFYMHIYTNFNLCN